MHTSAWGYAHCYFLLFARYVGFATMFYFAAIGIIAVGNRVAAWYKAKKGIA